MNKFDEQYYRVDFETAKLLKQAGFDKEVAAYWYKYPSGEPKLTLTTSPIANGFESKLDPG